MAIYDDRICRTCGAQFSGGPRAWYCPDCRRERARIQKQRYNREEMHRQLDLKQSLEYYRENKDQINPSRNERRRLQRLGRRNAPKRKKTSEK